MTMYKVIMKDRTLHVWEDFPQATTAAYNQSLYADHDTFVMEVDDNGDERMVRRYRDGILVPINSKTPTNMFGWLAVVIALAFIMAFLAFTSLPACETVSCFHAVNR